MNHPALTDDTATLLDLDPWSIQHARHLLTGLSSADRNTVDQARDEIVASVGSFAPQASLPRRRESSLQRLVLDRIESGGRWTRVRGHRPLPDAALLSRTASAP